MKRTSILPGLAAATLLIAPLAATAADLARPVYKAPAFEAPVYANWSGFYIGINGGYAFGKSDWDFPAASLSPEGALGGGTIGYNMQTGVLVWGFEGDFDAADIKGSVACGGGTCDTKIDWLATGRLRLGYAGMGNWLPYLTGGAAFADVKASNSILSSGSKALLGWTAGAGVEYALLSNWSAKVEYLYADLGSLDCGISCGATADDVSFKTSIVRGGVNYRF